MHQHPVSRLPAGTFPVVRQGAKSRMQTRVCSVETHIAASFTNSNVYKSYINNNAREITIMHYPKGIRAHITIYAENYEEKQLWWSDNKVA